MKKEYFDGNVFIELGLQNLPKDRKKELLEMMEELVMESVVTRLIEALPKKVHSTVQSQLEQGLTDNLIKAFQQQNIDVAEIIFEEVEKVKDNLVKLYAAKPA